MAATSGEGACRYRSCFLCSWPSPAHHASAVALPVPQHLCLGEGGYCLGSTAPCAMQCWHAPTGLLLSDGKHMQDASQAAKQCNLLNSLRQAQCPALPCRDRNFDDADRSGGGAEEEDAGPSRADQSDNWGRDRRPQEPDSRDRGGSRGFEDRPRMGGFRDTDSSGCASWGALLPALASA